MDYGVSFADSFPEGIMDAQYLLMPQEVRNINKDVRKVVYRKSVAQKIFNTEQIPRGRKEHRVSTAVAPSKPKMSMDFLPESMDKVPKSEQIFYLVGIHKDYFISMVDIDASRNSEYHKDKIDAIHLREVTAKVADVREQILWRGADCKDADPSGGIKAGLVGIVNTSGIQSFTADGQGNARLGTAGDGIRGTMDAIGKLITKKQDPPYDTVMTPWVFAQLAKNMNSTTHLTDLERIKGYNDTEDRQMIRDFYISDHLIKTEDDGSASAWVFLKDEDLAGQDNARILESYPLWHYPITTTRLGIQGKVLTMVGVAVIQPSAICFEDQIDVDGTA